MSSSYMKRCLYHILRYTHLLIYEYKITNKKLHYTYFVVFFYLHFSIFQSSGLLPSLLTPISKTGQPLFKAAPFNVFNLYIFPNTRTRPPELSRFTTLSGTLSFCAHLLYVSSSIHPISLPFHTHNGLGTSALKPFITVFSCKS